MYHLISNPASRSGAQQSALQQLKRRLDARHLPYHSYATTGPGSATEIAAAITAADGDAEPTIVVFGGDGTINEVLSGIQNFAKVRFGFLPIGSSNDFARGLGIDQFSDQRSGTLIKRILDNRVLRTIDLGHLHYDHVTETYSRRHAETISRDHIFAVSCGIGFDAAICEEALQSGTKDFLNKLHLGKLTYGAIAVKQLAKAPNTKCIITLDDHEELRIDRLLFAAVMNTAYEGGGYRFAPDADPSDGRLNLCAIGDMPRLKALSKFPAAHRGSIYHVDGVYHAMARKLRIEVAHPLWVHTDGEVSMQSEEITITALPHQLSLIV